MMTRIYSNNLVNEQSLQEIAADAVDGLPVSNLLDPQLSKVTRITGESITFTFKQSQLVHALVLANHTLSGEKDVILQTGKKIGTNTFQLSESKTFRPNGLTVAEHIQPINAEQVKISFPGQTSVDFGRIFIGTYGCIRRGLAPEGFSCEREDQSQSQKSVGGQEYTALEPQIRSYELAWNALTEEEKSLLENVYLSHGTHTPWFLWVRDLIPEPVYVKIDGSFTPELMPFSRPRRWDVKLELNEQR